MDSERISTPSSTRHHAPSRVAATHFLVAISAVSAVWSACDKDRDRDRARAEAAAGTAPAMTITPTAPAQVTAPAAELPPCPDRDAVASALAAIWRAGRDQTVEVAECAPLRHAGASAWLVLAWLDTGSARDPAGEPDHSELRRIVIGADRERRAEAAPEIAPPWYRAEGYTGELEIADLDGDGTDEVLERASLSKGGYTQVLLTVHRIAGDRIVALPPWTIEYDSAAAAAGDIDEDLGDESGDERAATACSATITVNDPDADGRRTLVVTPDNPGKLAECPVETATYALSDGALRVVE